MLGFRDIEAALALGPLGERSDYDLNPEVRALPGLSQRPAAVLCGIVGRQDGLHVVLTRRAAHLRHHAGQISFPGGKVDATDRSPLACALREAREEIGLLPGQVEVLGTLDGYLTVTGFRVTPFVARVDPHWQPILDPGEVAEVFEAPLDFLMDAANRRRGHYMRDGTPRHFWEMPWGGHHIWGATAAMLISLSDRLATLSVGSGQ